ncbi:CPBP family intramembrane glutamic endopeptidase [Pontixanthobacter luteolus]|uniref:CPBP family intramembrane glutamic endopeptidase n=1 Tax=Pontixanthobacter luteolus TaxID=295089 RepID=UPI002303F517|nr:type II CAAX endopeptidase family protein [Pontixanthobacter luteolus]
MPEIVNASGTVPTWRRVVAFPLVSLVIALGAAVGVILGFGWLVTRLPDTGLSDAAMMGLTAVIAVLLMFALSKVLLRHLGEMPRDDLPLKGAGRDTLFGFLGAGWLMTMCVGVAFILGAYTITGWGGSTSAPLILFQAGLFAGFVEEVIARGIIFRFLEEFAGSWAALVISALVFGFLHADNPNATWFSSLAISIEAGILLGAAYMYTRNLWLAIGLHAGWNIVQGYVWDVPVSGNQVDGLVESQMSGHPLISGGAFGLEASVIALVIATTAGVWLLREAMKKGHVIQPRWVRNRKARQPISE